VSTLNVLLSHQPAGDVTSQLRWLREIAPGSRFAVCHGGERGEFEALDESDKAFVDDPTLRAAARSFQSYHETFAVVWERWLRSEPSIDGVYLFEFDHLVLRPEFEVALRDLAARTGADLLGKNAGVRNGTNWEHYTRFRRDEALLAHLQQVSVRDDPTTILGTVACALWLSRAAIESYVAVPVYPHCYGELYVPTLLHHLGYRIVDVDPWSDLYRHVRWTPEYPGAEAEALRRSGATFLHPVKDPAARAGLLAAAASAAREPAASMPAT